MQDEKGLAESSRRAYLRAVSGFLEIAAGRAEQLFLPSGWLEAGDWNALDKRAVETYLNHLRTQRGWKPTSLAQQATALRNFFAFLQQRGHLERNPARSLKPRLPEREESLPEGAPEPVLRLFEMDPGTLKGARVLLLAELMYGGALQSSRVYGLRSLRVNGKAGVVKIETAEQAEEIALSPGGLERARNYLAQRKAVVGRRRQAPFWVDARGGPCTPARLARELKQEMERVGLPPRPSLLRQLAARHFAERGADTRSVRRLLRAKRLGSLDRYAPTDFQQVLRQFRQIHPRQGKAH